MYYVYKNQYANYKWIIKNKSIKVFNVSFARCLSNRYTLHPPQNAYRGVNEIITNTGNVFSMNSLKF